MSNDSENVPPKLLAGRKTPSRESYLCWLLLIFSLSISLLIPIFSRILHLQSFYGNLFRLRVFPSDYVGMGGLGATSPSFLFLIPPSIFLLVLRKRRNSRIIFSLLLCVPFIVNFIGNFVQAFSGSFRNFQDWAENALLLSPFDPRWQYAYSDRIGAGVTSILFDAIAIIAVIVLLGSLKNNSANPQVTFQSSSIPLGNETVPTVKGGLSQWTVRIPGKDDQVTDTPTLQIWARSGVIRPDSFIVDNGTKVTYQAKQIPEVFSQKSYLSSLLLSFFLGSLGVDRFYLGYNGLGIAKLLTFGGCGIWSLVDFILIAMRKIPDYSGKPLV